MWITFNVPPEPFTGFGLIRLTGAVLVAAACIAETFARADEPSVRRDGLLGLAVAHAMVYAVFALQTQTVWSAAVADTASQWLFAATLVLFGVWSIAKSPRLEPGGVFARLFGVERRPSTERLRSRYEEQIREAAGQEERNRLARDLHDSIKQQLFAIQTWAATAQTRLDATPTEARHAVDQIRTATHEAMTEMEAMLDQLRAAPLENVGLVEALKRQCEALGFRTGAHVTFESGPLPPSDTLPPGIQQALFRVAQEALANVGRHARATHVHVSLAHADAVLSLTIQDDGQGFTEGARAGMGLSNMRARAAEFQGTLAVNHDAGRGTQVSLVLPVVPPEDGPDDLRQTAWAWGSLLVISVTLALWQTPILFGAVAVIAAVGLHETISNRRALRARIGGGR